MICRILALAVVGLGAAPLLAHPGHNEAAPNMKSEAPREKAPMEKSGGPRYSSGGGGGGFAGGGGGGAPGTRAAGPKHGGVLQRVDGGFIETRFAEDGVTFWFYDASMKERRLDEGARVTMIVDGKVEVFSAPLRESSVHAPSALKNAKDVVVVVQGAVDKKMRTARVERPGK